MKIFLFSILSFALFNAASASDSYYYKGKRIMLEQRYDRIAIVLNSNYHSKEAKLRMLSSSAGINSDLKEISDNVYLLKFENDLNPGDFHSELSRFNSANTLIKFAAPVYRGEAEQVIQVPTDEFIVKLKDEKHYEKFSYLNISHNINVIGSVGGKNGYLLKSSNGVKMNALELSEMYFREGIFEYCEPNFIYPEHCLLAYVPNDPLFPKQWALRNTGQSVPTGSSAHGDQLNTNALPNADVDADLAWDVTLGSSSITIGIFDTGIDSTHPEFNIPGHIKTGYDAFFNKYGVPKDSGVFGGHGTCCAGISSAKGNNGIGVSGMAPGCRVMAYRIFNQVGSSTSIGLARAFDTARVIGTDVLSNSWGGMTPVSVLTDAINSAATHGRNGLGCIIFFASGNNGRLNVWYPSYLPSVESVGGSTTHDQKKSPGNGNQYYWGTNYGQSIDGDLDIVAPTICYSTDIQGVFGYNNTNGPEGAYFDSFRGTSCSTPLVAGIAGLVLSVNLNLTRTEVLDFIYRGCNKIDNVCYSVDKPFGKWNEYYGYGRANAHNSVKLASGIDVTPPTIVHKNIYSHSSTYPTYISAKIIDQNGMPVPDSGMYSPKLIYSISLHDTSWLPFDSVNYFSKNGNEYFFRINCLGYETQVRYYIKAHDQSGNSVRFPFGAPNPFNLCYFKTGELTKESRKIDGFTCIDPGVTYSPVVTFGDFTILNTDVQLFLNHPKVSDEILVLYSPFTNENNNRKCLFASNGGDASNIDGATVSDTSEFVWGIGSPPYAMGFFRGDYILNGFNGKNASGEWKLMNYDQFTGNQGVFDSIVISFTKTTGLKSPAIVIDETSDTIVDFGTINMPDSVLKEYYLKNTGTAELIIDSVSFSGLFGNSFQVISELPDTVSPGDSTYLMISFNTNSYSFSNADSLTGTFLVGKMTVHNNDPSKKELTISLLSEFIIRNMFTVDLRLFIQGLYSPVNDVTVCDTVFLGLRSKIPPFEFIDSRSGVLDSSGYVKFEFLNLPNEGQYILQLLHRNSLETWSRDTGLGFTDRFMFYDFTDSASKAYGENMVLLSDTLTRYGFISGDVNQDGSIDGSDLLVINNDAATLSTGYLPSDINGDLFIDGTDALIAGNNAELFMIKIVP